MRGGEGGSECPGRPALRSGQPAAPPTSAAAEPRGPGSGSITSGDGFSGRGDPGGMPGSVVCALDPLLGSSGGRVKVRVKFWAAGGICLPRQTDSPLAPLRPGNGSWAQTSRAGRGRVTDKEIEAERRSECPQARCPGCDQSKKPKENEHVPPLLEDKDQKYKSFGKTTMEPVN
uniref:Uncharacterized protein LOC110211545 isoform X4 n=1 Tax=Phascolarctos cinereus TaxID=38626 RepID=A0A6P5KLX2_PHACI|nr:uncharacterized protein LOC110211545 isoform X4 [Phascolarctos cinereus]